MQTLEVKNSQVVKIQSIKFDPKSDRWTRITMYQGAPGFDELAPDNADDWAFPAFLA